MTSAAIRVLKPRSHHLHSLGAFNKALPEFSDASVKANNLVDEAFKSSFVEEVADLKYWKAFRVRFLQKQQQLTPRELARLKYALSFQGKEAIRYANWGRSELHKQVNTLCEGQVPHMNAIELLSTLYGFRSLDNERLYESLYQALTKEIRSTNELDVLAVAPYIVAHSAIHTRHLSPYRPKEHTNDRNFAFLQIIQEMVADRITEFSDDQIAALCAGLSNSGIHPEKLILLKDLIDSIETDILNRRLDTMTGSNLVDVSRCFSKLNWGSDQFFTGIQKFSEQRFSTLSTDEVVDLAFHLTSRDGIEKSLKSQAEDKMVNNIGDVRSDFLGKVAQYLVMNLSSNMKLLKAVVDRIEAGKNLPLSRHYTFRKLRIFLDAKYPTLISDKFVERLEANAVTFNPQAMAKNPRYRSVFYQNTSSLIAQLGFRLATAFCYENNGVIDYAVMPQKIGINVALPAYDLLGKYEADDRLVKTTKRVFRPSKAFQARSDLFRLMGFKVIELNSHDLAENFDTPEARSAYILQTLSQEGLKPKSPRPPA